MNTNELTNQKLTLKILLSIYLVFSFSNIFAIGNGGFNGPPFTPWTQSGGCTIGSETGNKFGIIFPSPGVPLGTTGSSGCAIRQDFACGSELERKCYVRFRYKLKISPGVSAGLLIVGDQERFRFLRQPTLAPTPIWKKVQIEYPKCGNTSIYFSAMKTPAGPIGGEDDYFYIDDVECKCDIEGYNPAVYEPLTLEIGDPENFLFQFLLLGYNPIDYPMPVELSSFSSSIIKNNVTLNWTTTAEVNNSRFDVERKLTNSDKWNKVGFVNGNGTINEPKNYSFTDRNLNTGSYNYRLKQIDFNGNYEYYNLSGEVVIGISREYGLSQNFPNPFNPTTNISYQIPISGFVTLKIYDVSGKEVAKLVDQRQEAGYYTAMFDGSLLSSGIYFYKLTAGDFVEMKRMVLLK